MDELGVIDRLISYWQFHKGFDANIADLARYTGVSRDTVYRWLNKKTCPDINKIALIREWLTRKRPA